ncbi:MAG: LysR substrate-binding domain-containing protein [Hyphomicrobiaceae bacterium]
MNVRQLQALRAVIDLGSVTRAAENLAISQPAVSKLIKGLSRSCGFELFVRSGNRLVPTAEAISLFREVERMFVSVEDLKRHAEAIRDLRSGRMALAAFPALATRPLPKIITRFLRDHPDTRVSLIARSGRLLVELVAADRVDVAIGLMLPDHPAVRAVSIGSVEAVCVMAPTHHLARRKLIRATDLDGEAFISLGTEDQSRYRIDQAFEGTGVQRRITIEAQQSEAACSFASAGIGVAIVEPFSASEFSPDQLAIRPFRPRVRFDLSLLSPVYRQHSRIVESFVEVFRRSIPAATRRST